MAKSAADYEQIIKDLKTRCAIYQNKYVNINPYIAYANARKNLRKHLFELNEPMLSEDDYEMQGNRLARFPPAPNRPVPVPPSCDKGSVSPTVCSCGCGHSKAVCRMASRLKQRMEDESPLPSSSCSSPGDLKKANSQLSICSQTSSV